VRIPLLFLAGQPRPASHQLAADELRQRLLDLDERVEGVQAFDPWFELPRRLGAAQHENGEQRQLGIGQTECVVQQVPILDRTAARPAGEAHPAAPAPPVERGADGRLVVLDHGVSVGALVAGRAQGVERERIDVWGRTLLLDEAAENANLHGIEVHGGSLSTYSRAVEGNPRSTDFVALGHAGSENFAGLESFENPGVTHVQMTSAELTALGPVNSQPDLYVASIEYWPQARCLESKSLKLYLNSFRNEEAFCEALAVKIRDDVAAALELPGDKVRVTLEQNVRGGITITATA
jgi:7-cyano-7-deazaguanine reductase